MRVWCVLDDDRYLCKVYTTKEAADEYASDFRGYTVEAWAVCE